jgi:hypothetical protein
MGIYCWHLSLYSRRTYLHRLSRTPRASWLLELLQPHAQLEQQQAKFTGCASAQAPLRAQVFQQLPIFHLVPEILVMCLTRLLIEMHVSTQCFVSYLNILTSSAHSMSFHNASTEDASQCHPEPQRRVSCYPAWREQNADFSLQMLAFRSVLRFLWHAHRC